MALRYRLQDRTARRNILAMTDSKEHKPEHEPREQTWDEHGKDWHDRGPVWTNARRLYLKYPLLSVADIARILDVKRQRIDQCVTGLKAEREKRREDALKDLKRKEGL